MRIKIKTCFDEGVWYSKHIGETFEVGILTLRNSLYYKIEGTLGFIKVSDCYTIEDYRDQLINDIINENQD